MMIKHNFILFGNFDFHRLDKFNVFFSSLLLFCLSHFFSLYHCYSDSIDVQSVYTSPPMPDPLTVCECAQSLMLDPKHRRATTAKHKTNIFWHIECILLIPF